MGTVVQFERQPSERTIASHRASAPDPQGAFGIDGEHIEAAKYRCKVFLESIEKLRGSVDNLEKLQLVPFEPSDRQTLERQVTSMRSQLSSQLAKLADVQRALGDVAEHLPEIEVSLKHLGAKPDTAGARPA